MNKKSFSQSHILHGETSADFGKKQIERKSVCSRLEDFVLGCARRFSSHLGIANLHHFVFLILLGVLSALTAYVIDIITSHVNHGKSAFSVAFSC